MEKVEEIIQTSTGLLEFYKKGNKMISNAAIINGNGIPIIVTAAHCIYDWYTKTYSERMVFINGKKQRYEIDRAFMRKEWINEGIVDYDTAFLTLKNSFDMEMNKLVQPVFNLQKEQKFYISSIRNRFFGGNSMKVIEGTSFKDFIHNSTLIGVRGNLKSGSSGGPWLIEYENAIYQNSNTSLSFKQNKKIVWGPFWGPEIKDIYISSINGVELNKNIIINKI
ncbi:trypsin-like serine protease [Bacillus sp. NPDC094106]|uniref:trypsin-like serine protease n=1 Tax=Bacillus sp. NPDC094106 TaxID=3363949 RepID=UPI00381DFE7B